MIVLPAWTKKGTAEELERDIGNGFKFTGPGLYIREDEFDLAVLEDGNDWSRKHPAETVYEFHHYDCPIHESVFATIPVVRVDDR